MYTFYMHHQVVFVLLHLGGKPYVLGHKEVCDISITGSVELGLSPKCWITT
jgi:hypothetical protein